MPKQQKKQTPAPHKREATNSEIAKNEIAHNTTKAELDTAPKNGAVKNGRTDSPAPAAKAQVPAKPAKAAKPEKAMPQKPAKPAKAKKAAKPSKAAQKTLAGPTLAVYPKHLSGAAGWLNNLAKEQIHALATHTLARHTEQGLRTLAVTSSVAGEGKTTVSLALAEKLAAAGKRVLIIDLDTHRGTLSAEAKLGALSGAMESSAKRNGSPVEFHAYKTDRDGVSIMPTGRVDMTHGAPVLDPERIQALVQRALEAHDIVLLDCPPLLPVADTYVIGEVADSAILVVRAGSTPREVLEHALEEFGKEKFFAAILNRAKPYHIPYFREVYGYYRR